MQPDRPRSPSPTLSNTVDGHGLVMPPPPIGGAANAAPRALALAFMRYLNLTCQSYVGLANRCTQSPQLTVTERDAWKKSAALVTRAYARNQRALLGCFASPTLGTPLHVAAIRDSLPEFAARIDAALDATLPHLLLELSIRKLIEEREQVDYPHAPTLSTLVFGMAIAPPKSATSLRFGCGRLQALAGDEIIATLALDPASVIEGDSTGFSINRVFHRAGRVTRLGLLEHNPIAEFEAHPDKDGNHIDLGGHPASEWTGALDQAFSIIETHCPELFAEMAMMLHEVIPVGYHDERHLSASYREAIGTIWVTLHPNLMTMAEALIHEFQHNKMNVSAYSAEFMSNPFSPRYKSPVRPDPRPLWGILLAVHAFLPVAVMYRRMREANHPRSTAPDFDRRLSEIDLKNHEGMEMLRAHAEWLPAGRALFDELDALDSKHMNERKSRGLELAPTEVHLA